MMRVLDLFSGIGGFSLGLERSGGFETVAFCEIELFPRRVLAKHWPEVKQYGDVRELTADTLRRDGIAVDVITGGFPCQDISLAGRMQGLEGRKSGLWKEYFRLIKEIRPRAVIIENSPVLRSRGLGTMLRQFSEIGYDAEWHCIPVSALGAPHRRDRVWIIAYPTGIRDGLSEGQILTGRHLTQHGHWWAREPQICRVDDGTAGRVDRLRSLGNAVVPAVSEMIGRALIEARITHSAAAIRALKGTFPAVDGWRTMDSAPKKDRVLLWNGREVYEGYWGTTSYNRKTKDYDFAWVRHPSSGDTKPTRWQPLPAAPSTQEADHDNG